MGEPEATPVHLIHGDLLYYPDYKSGFQYAQVVGADKDKRLSRWSEAAWAWTKPAADRGGSYDYLGNVAAAGDFERFIARITMDKELWEAASKRGKENRDGYWVTPRREWLAGSPAPNYFSGRTEAYSWD